MLIVPTIDLQHGMCVRSRPGGAAQPTGYFDDPVEMAKLWRVLNAKALHLMNLDGLRRNESWDEETRCKVQAICEAVDIPVQLRGGIRTLDDVRRAFDLGVYRVVLGSAATLDPVIVEHAIDEHGASRIMVAVDVRNNEVSYEDELEAEKRRPEVFAQRLEKLGCRRIALTDMDRAGTLKGLNVKLFETVAGSVDKLRVTVCGGVKGYDDLVALKPLEALGVDSVVIERALYENAFPCQQFWCWHDMNQIDLDRFSTAELRP